TVADARRAEVTVSRTAVAGGIIPGAAAQQMSVASIGTLRVSSRAGPVVVGLVGVKAPLPNVAVHVEKAPRVGRVGADRARTPQIWPLHRSAIRIVTVEVSLGARQGAAEVEGAVRSRPCSAGIFPFR